MSDPEPMDVDKVIECLNEALAMQRRSVQEFTTASASMFGLEVQGVASELWAFARAELDDLRRIVEKVTALGGDPGTRISETEWSSDPQKLVANLIDHEQDALDALHAVIPHSGQRSDSEALEHLMEHIIMRKQNQVDWLQRAIRRP